MVCLVWLIQQKLRVKKSMCVGATEYHLMEKAHGI